MDPLISACCLLQKLKLWSQTSVMAELYSAQGKKKRSRKPNWIRGIHVYIRFYEKLEQTNNNRADGIDLSNFTEAEFLICSSLPSFNSCLSCTYITPPRDCRNGLIIIIVPHSFPVPEWIWSCHSWYNILIIKDQRIKTKLEKCLLHLSCFPWSGIAASIIN